jgi:hypothetical protein
MRDWLQQRLQQQSGFCAMTLVCNANVRSSTVAFYFDTDCCIWCWDGLEVCVRSRQQLIQVDSNWQLRARAAMAVTKHSTVINTCLSIWELWVECVYIFVGWRRNYLPWLTTLRLSHILYGVGVRCWLLGCRRLGVYHYNNNFRSVFLYKFLNYSFHLAVCLTTGPKTLPKRDLHVVRSRASFFRFEYPVLSLSSSSSFLRLVPCLPVTSIPPVSILQ